MLTRSEIQAAANTALQLVNQKLALRELQIVLSNIAQDISYLDELGKRREALHVEIDQLEQAKAKAQSKCDTAEARAAEQFAAATAEQQAKLQALRDETAALQHRRDAALAEAEQAEKRLTSVRIALSAANAAVA